MSVEIKLRPKYLHHQVKKVSSKGGGTSGSSKKNRHVGPSTKGKSPVAAPTRERVMVLLEGRRVTWIWRAL